MGGRVAFVIGMIGTVRRTNERVDGGDFWLAGWPVLYRARMGWAGLFFFFPFNERVVCVGGGD